ncbi:MAG: hypothetical protein M0Z67_15460 [Nitrospiraceae bacterium]|nr:hypothetical protein [Nitrospiraceae bacterium]
MSIVVDFYYAVMKEGLSLYEDFAVDSRSTTMLVVEWTQSSDINRRKNDLRRMRRGMLIDSELPILD